MIKSSAREQTPEHPLIFSPPAERRFAWLQHAAISDIIDVGSHTGMFVERIRTILPAARLYCFEPLSREFAALNEKLSGDPSAILFNTALGEAEGETTIQRCDYSESSSILPMADLHKDAFPFTRHSEPEKIRISRLDDCLRNYQLGPRPLLKIDAQGYELHVLRGAPDTLQKTVVLIIEVTFRPLYEGQPLFDDVYDFLRPLGFRYAGHFDFDGSAQLLSPIDGTVLQADAIFLRD